MCVESINTVACGAAVCDTKAFDRPKSRPRRRGGELTLGLLLASCGGRRRKRGYFLSSKFGCHALTASTGRLPPHTHTRTTRLFPIAFEVLACQPLEAAARVLWGRSAFNRLRSPAPNQRGAPSCVVVDARSPDTHT